MNVRVDAAPKWLTGVPEAEIEAGDGLEVCEFIEAHCRTTKDTIAGGAGELIRLRGWQSDRLDELFARRADGRRRFRVGLIGLARKNGKSALGSSIALHGLYLGPAGAEVYSCAADRDQARIVFGVAKRMIELDPVLSGEAKLYRDAVEIPSTGSVYRVLSSEAFTKEGLSPTLVIYDELHAAPNDELWNVMNLGSGARHDPLVLAITTAGVMSDSAGSDSVCFRLYQHGKKVAAGEVDDPSFYFAWWEPDDPKADHRLEGTWEEANPGLGDLVDVEDFESAVRRTPEPEFRTKRCNQFVETADAWFPVGVFEGCASNRPVPEDGEEIVIFVDGSYARDATGVMGCTLDGHLFTLGHWENHNHDPDWKLPTEELDMLLRECFDRWHVRVCAGDSNPWLQTYQELEASGFPMLAFPTNHPSQMVPATSRFYAAVQDRELTHDGNPALLRHVRQVAVRRDRHGARIEKDKPGSPRKVDLAIAAVGAYHQAMIEAGEVDVEVTARWL